MAHFVAALALAGAFVPLTPTSKAEPATHVAQFARDVTDAVRKQRAERRARSDATHQTAKGKKR